jgi:hypothetical protein
MLIENRTSNGAAYNTFVIAIITVQVFPWPMVDRTLYCADFGEVGLVPVGYAIYH